MTRRLEDKHFLKEVLELSDSGDSHLQDPLWMNNQYVCRGSPLSREG